MGEYLNKWLPQLKADSKPVAARPDVPVMAKRKCDKCGLDYEPKIPLLWGVPFDLSGTRCPDCRAVEAQTQAENEKASLSVAIASQAKKWRASSGIDPKYMSATFENFRESRTGNINKAKALCQQYADDFPLFYREYLKLNQKAYRSLLLFSTLDMCGVGKTHLVSAVLHRVLNRWQGQGLTVESRDARGLPLEWRCTLTNPVLFISEPELYLNIRTTYSYNQEERQRLASETDILNRLVYRDLLVIDDIGKVQQRDMDFVQKTLYSIVNGRYKALRPLILTTNKQPQELKAYVGDATFDRIYEMCHGKFFQVIGDSFRTQKEAWE